MPAPKQSAAGSKIMEAASAAIAVGDRRAARSAGPRLVGWLWSGLLLALLAFLVLYPVFMLLFGAVTGVNPVVDGFHPADVSFNNFATGLAFAWIVVRTNTPWKGLIATAGLLPLFVPPLVAAVAWAILGSPRTGLLNTMLASIGVEWRLNLYSMPGLIAIFGMYYAPYVYMFTSAALRNMDPSLEEAAELSGASALRTLLTVTFPLIAPAIISGMLLSFIIMLGIYGIPAVLGTPANIAVLTTYI